MKNLSKFIFRASTISYKISETNFSFHVKERTTEKVQTLFLGTFLLVLTKFLLWQAGWELGYHSLKFRYFPTFS